MSDEEEIKEYSVGVHLEGYMVRLRVLSSSGCCYSSIQWFLSKDDARTCMFLLQAGMAPWTVYQLVMGRTEKQGAHPTYPPHEKTYRERFGQ